MRSVVTILCAMRAEANPIIAALGLRPSDAGWGSSLPMRCWRHPGSPLTLVINGVDSRTGADLIGTTPATLATHAVVQHLRPAVVLVARTAGGHSQRTEIGRVYMVDRAFHHDRPPAWVRSVRRRSGAVAPRRRPCSRVRAAVASISTGNSLDTLDAELAFFDRHGVTLKDMETASVAWTASLFGTRVMAVRSVTDFFDHPAPAGQFLSNFNAAAANLTECVARGLPALMASCGSHAGA